MPTQLKFSQAFPLIKATLASGKTPALLGEPGIGKSSLVEDLSKEFKTEVFTLPVNQLADRADLTGVRMVKNEKTGIYRQEAFPHSTIMDAIEYADAHPDEFPILFLDEFNRATPDITSSILSFQTLRRVGTINLPDNLRLIVAGNDHGNVTSLDQASISRFTLYNVKPDIETFMSVQPLNPYIQSILSKYPEDLTASKIVTQAVTVQDDDDEEDEDGSAEMFGLEFDTEDTFEQITRPRTITYLSEWMDEMGLDNSGSDAEKQLLGSMFSDIGDGDQSVLLAAIEGHVGSTTFAQHLFDEIQGHFNAMLTSKHTTGQPVLGKLRPNQTLINELSRATTTQEIESLVSTLDQDALRNASVWLLENQNTKEINNNDAVQSFIKNALESIDEIDNKSLQNMMLILPVSSKLSQVALNAMLSSTADSIASYLPIINSLIDQN